MRKRLCAALLLLLGFAGANPASAELISYTYSGFLRDSMGNDTGKSFSGSFSFDSAQWHPSMFFGQVEGPAHFSFQSDSFSWSGTPDFGAQTTFTPLPPSVGLFNLEFRSNAAPVPVDFLFGFQGAPGAGLPGTEDLLKNLSLNTFLFGGISGGALGGGKSLPVLGTLTDVAAVPEPASIMVFAVALGIPLVCRSRRRRARVQRNSAGNSAH